MTDEELQEYDRRMTEVTRRSVERFNRLKEEARLRLREAFKRPPLPEALIEELSKTPHYVRYISGNRYVDRKNDVPVLKEYIEHLELAIQSRWALSMDSHFSLSDGFMGVDDSGNDPRLVELLRQAKAELRFV